jgi:hypothetical protein
VVAPLDLAKAVAAMTLGEHEADELCAEGTMARHACARRAPQGDLHRSDRCGEGSMEH